MITKLSMSLVWSLFFFATCVSADGPAKKVLILGIDGCRPDALLTARTPNIDDLMRNGSFSMVAQTGDITDSGPGWSSALTGVWRNKHGVVDNSFDGARFQQFPHFFKRIKDRNEEAFTASIVH